MDRNFDSRHRPPITALTGRLVQPATDRRPTCIIGDKAQMPNKYRLLENLVDRGIY